MKSNRSFKPQYCVYFAIILSIVLLFGCVSKENIKIPSSDPLPHPDLAQMRSLAVEERDGAIFTLHRTLSTILKLLAPITPFITDHLWRTLYSSGSIHKERQVEAEETDVQDKTTEEITEFNSKVWNEKKAKGLSLKDSFAYPVPESLKAFEKDLKSMHNLE